MRFNTLFVTFLSLFTSLQGHAAERAFQVFETKRITPLVERFYGHDNNAFATVFCDEKLPQVMIVDSRLQDLDGKTFYFESLETCNNARMQAQQLRDRCTVELVINQESQKASSRASRCR